MSNNPYGNQPIGATSYAPTGSMGEKPKNYLVESIITTFCCCLPLGVASIIFAAQVDGKWNSGDLAGALASANTAKKIIYVNVGLTLAGYVAAVVMNIIVAAGAAAGAQGN